MKIDKCIYILGNGAYSRNVQICCKELKISYEIITREDWNKIVLIKDSIIFNCTPVENIDYDISNIFIDCNINSVSGKKLAIKQASIQFELYTGKKFPEIITYNDL
jgi:shikimate 5-dehydrogenase